MGHHRWSIFGWHFDGSAYNVLQTLSSQLETLESEIAVTETKLDLLKREHAKNEEKQKQAENQLEICRQTINTVAEQERVELAGKLEVLLEASHGQSSTDGGIV